MEQARPPEIFDRRRRHAMQERAFRRSGGAHFLWDILAEELADRLACTTRSFEKCLVIGPLAHQADTIAGAKAKEIVTRPFAEEDRLEIEPASFDLIIAAGTLDSVNDLPGALVQIRRAMRPDGLFLGALFGAGSLASLKKVMMLADGHRIMSHIHPQIELRSASDLLARTGFAMQVADRSGSDVRYGDWRTLIEDLRDAGIGNCLSGSRGYLGKQYPDRLESAWSQHKDKDGKVSERFEFIHLSGWSPSPDQPKAAARGSGKVSLAALLDKSGKD
ncbi:MAG: methyltransferase domain-containing protein [Sphingorhabdus sp.]